MAGGRRMAGLTTLAVAMLALVAVDEAQGWGSYQCAIQEGDFHRLSTMCDKTQGESVIPKLEVITQKLTAFLENLRGITHLEDSWFGKEHDGKTSTTVERDLSKLLSGETMEFARIDKDYIETLSTEPVTTEVPATMPTTSPTPSTDATTTTTSSDATTATTTTTTTTTTTEAPTTTVSEELDGDPNKGECHAKEIPKHETVGMFFMTSFRHGHCANRRATSFPVRFCLGYCATRTFIDREENMWTHGDKCSSCQPHLLETVRIPLVCEDGYTFHRTFENIVECSCKGCQRVEV